MPNNRQKKPLIPKGLVDFFGLDNTRVWRAMPGSNRRHQAPEACALSAELIAQIVISLLDDRVLQL